MRVRYLTTSGAGILDSRSDLKIKIARPVLIAQAWPLDPLWPRPAAQESAWFGNQRTRPMQGAVTYKTAY